MGLENKKFEKLLSQNIIFVKNYIPLNFKTTMGILAVEVNYSNGDKDVFQSKTPPHMGNSSFDFDTEEEYFEFCKWLNSNNISIKS